MAKFVPGFDVEGYLLEQLKCRSCSKLMKQRPIFMCSNNHCVCTVCWMSSVYCTSCFEIYEKDLKQDTFEGTRLYEYPCANKCINVIKFNRQWSIIHRLSGSDNEPYEFKCGQCGEMSGKLYRYNGALVPEEKFFEKVYGFMPLRNEPLENVAVFAVDPADVKGRPEEENHDVNSFDRIVTCPALPKSQPHSDEEPSVPMSLYCEWRGTVHALVDHVSDITKHATIIDSNDGLGFIFPSQSCDDLNPLFSQKVFIHIGTVSSVIVAKLDWPHATDGPLKLTMVHVGPKKITANLTCMIRLHSKFVGNPTKFRNLKIQNDLEVESAFYLWKMSCLKKGGYVFYDEEVIRVDLQVIIQELDPDLLSDALRGVSIAQMAY